MIGFFKNLSSDFEEKRVKPCGEKLLGFIKAHPDVFCLSLLAIACLLFLFMGIELYPLLDVDETRYAVMSRDLLNSWEPNNLMLNYEPFLEKPPLYFWLVAASIKIFGGFSSFAVRFPIALCATFLTFFTYFLGKKVIDRKFGLVSALVLLTSVFFLVLAHVAILDMVLTVFIASSIYCGFLTHFCEDKYKKYAWWYFYIFAGLAFLAKGILGLILPVAIIFTYNFITKNAKDIFKPINILPGFALFFIIILPWHIDQYAEYGNTFINEYFLRHHFARFIDSASIGRERPFLYFIPVFLLGFLPWSFNFIAFLIDGGKKLISKYKQAEGKAKDKFIAIFDAQTNEQKLILFASIYFFLTLLIFSVSSTKLPTYILPLFPAAALLTGYFWWNADEKAEYEKTIAVTTQLLAGILIIATNIASVGLYFIPYDLQYKIEAFKNVTLITLLLVGLLMLLRLKVKRALSVFPAYILLMLVVVSISVTHIFNLVYKGGEDEIVQYSSFAKQNEGKLVTFDFAVKPSAMIPYDRKVQFLTDPDFDKLDKELEHSATPTFVIIKNKSLDEGRYNDKIRSRLELIQIGDRYSLYVKDVNNEFNNRGKHEKMMHEEFGFAGPIVEPNQAPKN